MKYKDVWVYIASPYTQGDQAMNVRFQHTIWDVLFQLGVTPIAPLLSHYQHIFQPRPYEDWIAYDDSLVSRCDVCLRLAACERTVKYRQEESPGADREVAMFMAAGKPVFTNLVSLELWLQQGAGR
jgi:hypothetical protein